MTNPQRKPIPYDIRVAACADYLIGVPIKNIVDKYKVSNAFLQYHIRKAGFKLRSKRNKV